MLIGHVSFMVKLATILGLKPIHSICLPLSSIEGTSEMKLVVVIPSSETVSENGSIISGPFRHLIVADGFEPIHWHASSIGLLFPLIPPLLIFCIGVMMRISLGLTGKFRIPNSKKMQASEWDGEEIIERGCEWNSSFKERRKREKEKERKNEKSKMAI